MSIFKTSAIALAILASVAAVPAHAVPTASAAAVVSFENFQISWVGLARQVNATTDFTSLSVTASQLTAANMTGSAGTSMNPSTTNAAPTKALSSVGAVDASLNSAGGLGAITSSQRFNVPTLPMVGNFSLSASNDEGTPIKNFPSGNLSTRADLHNASYASLDSMNGTAGTSTSSQLSSTQFFTSAVGGDKLRFSFELGAYVGAFLSAGAAQSASAEWSISFNLFNTTNNTLAVFQSFSDSTSNNSPGNGVTETGTLNSPIVGGFSTTSPFFFDSGTIIAGNRYQLTATIATRTQVERQYVPEPGALALVGLALTALGVTRRREKRA